MTDSGRAPVELPEVTPAGSNEALSRVGPFRIDRELRRGGMGVVYLATREGEAQSASRYALKMALAADAHSHARFEQEIRATQGLDHDAIVRVVEAGEWHGRLWYAMDFIGASNLADLLAVRGVQAPDDLPSLIAACAVGDLPLLPLDERIGLPQSAAVTLMASIASAVAHAHARGVLHRDLKPANIILDADGRPVLADFGVARDLEQAMRLTAVDEVVGTYVYIAPEQLAGEDIDERVDVYGLGAILYETLIGRPPPRRYDGAEPLPELARLPGPLRRIVYSSLEVQPARRLPTALALATELRRYHAGEPVRARGVSTARRLLRLANRHLLLSALLLALMLVGVLALLYWLQRERRQTVTWQLEQRLELAGLNSLIRQPRSTPSPGEQIFSLGGSWQLAVGGLTADPADPGLHPALAFRSLAATGRRVELQARTGPVISGELSLFIDARQAVFDGYTFQLGAYDNSCALLKRGGKTLWLGPGRLEPERPYRLSLQRLGDELAIAVDGSELLRLQETLPVEGQLCGFFTYRQRATAAAPPPIFERFSIHRAEAPELVPPDWPVVRLAQVGAELSGGLARRTYAAAADITDDLLQRLPPNDGRRDQIVLRHGALAEAAGAGIDLSQQERLLARGDGLRQRMEYHRQLLLLAADREPAALPERYYDALRQLADPIQRVALACWVDSALGESLPLDSAVVQPALQVLPRSDPAWHFLAFRGVDHLLRSAADPDRRLSLLADLVAVETDSWWRRRARQEDLRLQLVAEPFHYLDSAQVERLIDNYSLAGGVAPAENLRLQAVLLGGPWLLTSAGPEEARLRALLGGGPSPLAPPQNASEAQKWRRQLQRAAQTAPSTYAELREAFPCVVELLALAPAIRRDGLGTELLAAWVAAYPQRSLPARLLRLSLRYSDASGVIASFPLGYSEGWRPAALQARLQPPLAALARQIWAAAEPSAAVPPGLDLDSHLAPTLLLLAARAALDRDDRAGATELLERLSALSSERPAVLVGRLLKRQEGL